MLTLPARWSPDCAREPRMPFLGLPGRSLRFRDPVAVAERLGLLAESAAPDPPQADGALDSLIDWMHAHCHEPISLTELEQRSHYSRRNLQYAFKARFGCGPMQYLRRQRLWQARRRLERADPGSTLSGIALASGYLSLESFRRDFRRRFGVAPSVLLARGRARRGVSGLS
jgi:transcriptional regulator GlxA family with amidase domain